MRLLKSVVFLEQKWKENGYSENQMHPLMNGQKFENRHIGISALDVAEMLKEMGESSTDDLIKKTIPNGIWRKKELDLPPAMSEMEFSQHMQELGAKNKVFTQCIGLGYYDTHLPAVIQRNILENAGWYTAYTPYQPEISQGRLEALLNFQTVVTEITAMEIANASLLDESTATAEAATMLYAHRTATQKKNKASRLLVSSNVFPQNIEVLKTRTTPTPIECVVSDEKEWIARKDLNESVYALVLQYPNLQGEIEDYGTLIEEAKRHDIKIIIIADLLALTLLTPPGTWGVDAVVGTTQRFGVPIGYGGPHAAYFATLEKYKRSLPGRIIGVSKDVRGNTALRMALQTREQHIRRERATSNICTAQALLAVMAGMYAVHHGREGLQNIAENIATTTREIADIIGGLPGLKITNRCVFDTFRVTLDPKLQRAIRTASEQKHINFYYPSPREIQVSLGELSVLKKDEIIEAFCEGVGAPKPKASEHLQPIASNQLRTDGFLKQQVFAKYRSETELMRYMKQLENKDLSLNHSMIPLGSCTMKLNPAVSMFPLSQAAWNSIHPFAPENQTGGYMEVIRLLEKYFADITGLHATSLQPNSGAQGEFAGLMTIRSYQKSIGQGHRNIVIIPASAHGTNPASGVMAGLKVVVVKCNQRGDIDLADLKQKVETHKDHLSCLMITYPSTHGVFEDDILTITELIHRHGGQVYMDGANMNAQVGLTSPGDIGADVCHLNLHKTFAIPHGGGGPGMGPICVAKHLENHLPSHFTNPSHRTFGISGAPFGSALILTISYAYIRLLGKEGVTRATKAAILNANYLKSLLSKNYKILYVGKNGAVAHEMIIDCNEFKALGIQVIDIAKRLIDYGYHAPTVSFPVPGTLMVEPTESESRKELQNFARAMLGIRKEIRKIEEGTFTQENNPLKNAPHTMSDLAQSAWDYPYHRIEAAFPDDSLFQRKFWPSVGRIDEAYGDRNFMCSCDPLEDYI